MCKVHVLAHRKWTHFSELKHLELCHCTASAGTVSGFPKLHGTAKLLWSTRDFFPAHPSLANTRDEESHRSRCKLHKTAEGWQTETKSIVGQFSSFHEENLAPEANWRLHLQENLTLSASHISNGEKDVTSHLNHREEFLWQYGLCPLTMDSMSLKLQKKDQSHKPLSIQQILRCFGALSSCQVSRIKRKGRHKAFPERSHSTVAKINSFHARGWRWW